MEERDLGVQLSKEAAAAFGNFVGSAPAVPELSRGGKMLLDQYAQILGVMAARMKEKAQEANLLGEPNLGLLLLRAQLSVEETGEFIEALAEGETAKVFKELVDMSVVTDGHYLTLGLQELKLAGLRAVYGANLTKLVGGKPLISPAGRHIKGPDYKAPDMDALLREAGK